MRGPLPRRAPHPFQTLCFSWLSAAKGLGLANKGYVIGVAMTKFEEPGPELGQQQDLPPRRSSMTLSSRRSSGSELVDGVVAQHRPQHVEASAGLASTALGATTASPSPFRQLRRRRSPLTL